MGDKLFSIATLLTKHSDEKLGLLGGLSGKSLFFFYLWKVCHNEKYIKFANQLLSDAIDIAENDDITMNYAEGITGLCCLIRHLQNNKLLHYDNIIDSEIDKCIYEYCINSIYQYQDDFFYGAGGAVLFLIQNYIYNPNCLNKKYLENILFSLSNRGKSDNVFTSKDIDNFNTGIPHGYSSWILLLCRIHRLNIATNLCEAILNNLVNYYKPFLYNTHKGDSYFPLSIIKSENSNYIHSRLGWCNGDLAILYSLLRYAEISNDKNMAYGIILKLINVSVRDNLSQYSIWDASICHGSGGLMHIFIKLYEKYKIKQFRYAADFWMKTSFALGNNYTYNASGFVKSYPVNGKLYNSNEFGFIDGLAGIGLAILSYKYKCYNWDELLLL